MATVEPTPPEKNPANNNGTLKELPAPIRWVIFGLPKVTEVVAKPTGVLTILIIAFCTWGYFCGIPESQARIQSLTAQQEVIGYISKLMDKTQLLQEQQFKVTNEIQRSQQEWQKQITAQHDRRQLEAEKNVTRLEELSAQHAMQTAEHQKSIAFLEGLNKESAARSVEHQKMIGILDRIAEPKSVPKGPGG